MRIQKSSVATKQWPIGRRNPIAAVFTGDEERIGKCLTRQGLANHEIHDAYLCSIPD